MLENIYLSFLLFLYFANLFKGAFVCLRVKMTLTIMGLKISRLDVNVDIGGCYISIYAILCVECRVLPYVWRIYLDSVRGCLD